MFRTSTKDMVKSKAMLGGLLLVGLGVYLVVKGNTEQGMLAVGNGLGIMGIRDKQ